MQVINTMLFVNHERLDCHHDDRYQLMRKKRKIAEPSHYQN